ncbi:MocR-like pyridoxine biosynthesis transcription factor PdxR [Cohnella sp. 56]|uniref:MocR-like pyridoxine biosynthesis transcription factor PdxR n=1 Tax=Cohnella sp. 56 TaxID=3113722 RepID=UPI0030E79ACD
MAIDKASKVPMLSQVYQSLRSRILSGELEAGCKLPSSRALASQLGVSRNIVLEAYERLLAEGIVVARTGAGTFVAKGAALPAEDSVPSPSPAPPPVWARPAVPLDETEPGGAISFRTGSPAMDRFPRNAWSDALRRVCREAPDSLFGYGDPAGEPELRAALAAYLRHSRGVETTPDRIVVTGGAIQALGLAAQLLLSPGDDAIVERPTIAEVRSLIGRTGARVHGVPVDEAGLRTSMLPDGIRPKLIYVTPSHQFPLGGAMPIPRRIELLAYAARSGGYVLEDDYDSEFIYDAPAVHSLHSLAPERVLYIGTFSKILSPALRLGYIVLPAAWVPACTRLKRLADYENSRPEQLALAGFLERRTLHAHVHRMRKLYRRRRQMLVDSLREGLGDRLRVLGRAAGLHIAVRLAAPPADLQARLREAGVEAALIGADCLLLGYGHLQEDAIREGAARLARALGSAGLPPRTGAKRAAAQDEEAVPHASAHV